MVGVYTCSSSMGLVRKYCIYRSYWKQKLKSKGKSKVPRCLDNAQGQTFSYMAVAVL